jgi:AcrR family transcriptional regulator
MGLRIERIDDTRLKIIQAAVQLHGSIGPAATTVMAIAEQAGVTRTTVYRHFPDDASLFQACSTHWLAQQVAPNPAAWAAITEPEARIRDALTDLYRFYRAGEPMLTRVYRDIRALPEQHRSALMDRDGQFRDVLFAAFPQHIREEHRLRAVLGHAVSFSTWRSLCLDHELPNDAAVDAMVSLAMITAAHDDDIRSRRPAGSSAQQHARAGHALPSA